MITVQKKQVNFNNIFIQYLLEYYFVTYLQVRQTISVLIPAYFSFKSITDA